MSKKNIIYIVAAVIVVISVILIIIAKRSSAPEVLSPSENVTTPENQQSGAQNSAQIEQNLQGIDTGSIDQEFQQIDDSLKTL